MQVALHALTPPKVTWLKSFLKQTKNLPWFAYLYQVQRKGETSSSIFPSSLLQRREDKGSSGAWSLQSDRTGFESQLYMYWLHN